jgi:hypothetical protein
VTDSFEPDPFAVAAERCAACGDVFSQARRDGSSEDRTCRGCGFSWGDVALAKAVVDAVIRAIDMDAWTLSRAHYRDAMDAVLAVLVDPSNPEPHADGAP